MDIKKSFGIFFTLLGTAILLFSVYVMLTGSAPLLGNEISGYQAIISAILGLIFFSAGVKFIR